MTYGLLKDSTTGQPLFNDKAWEISDTILENIQRGYYSDPPNIPLYYSHPCDKYGLLRYKCCHSTTSIEGGVHQNIICWFGAFNAAPDFGLQLLHDYVLYHNLKVHSSTQVEKYLLLNYMCSQVGTLNHTGLLYMGSFDIWMRNHISCLLDILSHKFQSLPASFGLGGWVSGDNYV
jgi:hypothetical protein